MRWLQAFTIAAVLLVCAASDVPPSFLGKDQATHGEPWAGVEQQWKEDMGAAAASLVASPAWIESGQDVEVMWSNVTGAQGGDWVAIYCPVEGGTDTDYLDWEYASGASSGSLMIGGLVNMRCNYTFRYYGASKDAEGHYPLVAQSNAVSFYRGSDAPMQLHLALVGGESQAMLATWVTASNQHDNVVQYGLTEVSLTEERVSGKGTSVTYEAGDMCGSPANVTSQQLFRDPGYIHSVAMKDLHGGRKYFYRVGNDVEGWSEVNWFKTPPDRQLDLENEEESVSFAVYGDMGVGKAPRAESTVELCLERVEELDFVLHIGDISYARGHGYVWEQFFALIQPLAQHVPYMISIGNHEYDHISGGWNDPSGAPGVGFHPTWGNYGDDSSGECSVPMYNRFTMPANGNSIYWYSYNYGPVHVVMLSTEHDYVPGSPQYSWLEADLAAVNRSATPFVVLTGHRAMYCSEAYWSDWEVSLGMRFAMEPLLVQYDVDIAFWGHYHAYERTCRVVKGVCTEDGSGTVHVVVGTAGAALDNPDYKVDRPWSVAYVVDFGVCFVKASRELLVMQFILNSDGSVADEVGLYARH